MRRLAAYCGFHEEMQPAIEVGCTVISEWIARVVKTYRRAHIALAMRDVERSLRFYEQAFGVEVYFRGVVIHFGFRLQSPGDIDVAVAYVESAGANRFAAGNSAQVSLRIRYRARRG